MKITTKLVTKEVYDDILCGWWKDWRWTPPKYEMLPQTGIIIYNDEVPVCAGFVYFTNSKMAWVEYIVSNFHYRAFDRDELIELTINTLSELAKDNGFNYLYTSLKNKHLVNKYKKCGYLEGDSNCQEMIKVWQQ